MSPQDRKEHGAGRLVAVVVTFNRLEQLQVTLGRLLDHSRDTLAAVLVIDNATTDGTGAWLEGLAGLAVQDGPEIMVHRCDTNTGGAGGFETGMRLAVARFDPDWMVVMDDDARPEPGALAAFHAAPDRSAAQAWAAAVYHPDGQICDMNRPSINPFWHPHVFWRTVLGKGRDGFHLGPKDYDSASPRPIDGTSFVGFFISREGLKLAGFPDGRLFLYGDDVLYTLGLTRLGGRILFDPAIRFEHDFSTMTEQEKRFRPLWKCYYHYRNLLMIYRLCSGWLFVLTGPAAAVKWLLKVRYHSGERRAFLGYVFRALRDGLLSRTDFDHQEVLAWGRKHR